MVGVVRSVRPIEIFPGGLAKPKYELFVACGDVDAVVVVDEIPNGVGLVGMELDLSMAEGVKYYPVGGKSLFEPRHGGKFDG